MTDDDKTLIEDASDEQLELTANRIVKNWEGKRLDDDAIIAMTKPKCSHNGIVHIHINENHFKLVLKMVRADERAKMGRSPKTNDEILTKHFTKQYPEQRAKDWLENYKQSNDDWNILMNKARLAALDDCKTLLEVIVARFERKNTGGGFYSGEITGLKLALAELEALRKKVEK